MMKRVLPVLIVICLIGAIFCCLPTNKQQTQKQPKTLDDLNGCKVGIQTGLNYEDYLADSCPGAEQCSDCSCISGSQTAKKRSSV